MIDSFLVTWSISLALVNLTKMVPLIWYCMYMCTIVAIQIYREINKEYSGLAFCFWNIDSKSAVQLSPSCKGSKNIYTHSKISVNIALSVDMKKASLLPVKVHIGYIYVWLQRYFSGQISFCEFWIGSPNFTATGKLLLFKVSMERSCSLVLLAVCGMFQFESKSQSC